MGSRTSIRSETGSKMSLVADTETGSKRSLVADTETGSKRSLVADTETGSKRSLVAETETGSKMSLVFASRKDTWISCEGGKQNERKEEIKWRRAPLASSSY